MPTDDDDHCIFPKREGLRFQGVIDDKDRQIASLTVENARLRAFAESAMTGGPMDREGRILCICEWEYGTHAPDCEVAQVLTTTDGAALAAIRDVVTSYHGATVSDFDTKIAILARLFPGLDNSP